MAKIDAATIEKLEILSKLTLSGEEKRKAAEELEKLLTYMEKVNEPDTDGVAPLLHSESEKNGFREDEAGNPNGREALLANAPVQKDGQFVVPKTV